MPYGLSQIGAENALDDVLPNATNVYVALLTTLPTDFAGTGLVEASAAGYARTAHSAWTTSSASNVVTRANNGAITFPALTADLSGVVGWAIYTMSSGGDLLAFGQTVDGSGNPLTVNFVSTDEPRFANGELEVKIEVNI